MQAGRTRFWGRIWGQRSGSPDIPVTPFASDATPRTWAVRAALVASTLGLLGTSAEEVPRGTHHFHRHVEAEAVDLTADEPGAVFLVTVRADALGPDDTVTTDAVSLDVVGSIAVSDIEGEDPPVAINLNQEKPGEYVRAFNLGGELKFDGTCEAPSTAPCQATFQVSFQRSDFGDLGGAMNVAWSFDLTSTANFHGGGDQPETDPPWTVEITRQ